jgi:hypothetical protein
MQYRGKDNNEDDIKKTEYKEVDSIHLPASFEDGNELQGSRKF